MILAIRVNGEMLAFSPKNTEEAVQKFLEYHKHGAYVDYWNIIPEGTAIFIPTRG